MSDSCGLSSIDDTSSLYGIIRNCATFQSSDSLPVEDFNDACFFEDYSSSCSIYLENCAKMLSSYEYSVSGNTSSSSYSCEASIGDYILEENGRISLAYENLRTIPRHIAEKFAMRTKFLDLSHNNFQNLSFLSYFEDLDTLILDRNTKLNVNSLPFLQNLKILWINNCDIKNVFDWIYRIRTQCPNLEYLSIMGNPGIQEVYSNCHFDMLNIMPNMESVSMPTNRIADHRDFILQMLPNLHYLDDSPRTTSIKSPHYSGNSLRQSTTSSSLSPATSTETSSSSQSEDNRKISPSRSFKELLLMMRRKNSYPSSSTN